MMMGMYGGSGIPRVVMPNVCDGVPEKCIGSGKAMGPHYQEDFHDAAPMLMRGRWLLIRPGRHPCTDRPRYATV